MKPGDLRNIDYFNQLSVSTLGSAAFFKMRKCAVICAFVLVAEAAIGQSSRDSVLIHFLVKSRTADPQGLRGSGTILAVVTKNSLD